MHCPPLVISPRLRICEEVDHLTVKGRARFSYLAHPENLLADKSLPRRRFFVNDIKVDKTEPLEQLHLGREGTPGGGAARKSFGPVDNDIKTISKKMYF